MDAKALIGQHVRSLREEAGLTQDKLATETGITYQYLSGLENGRENFSIDILASLAGALRCPLPRLISGAYAASKVQPPTVDPKLFRQGVPLPPGLTLAQLERALNATQRILALINVNLRLSGAKPLVDYVQGNNFSGLVANVLCDSLHEHSDYKHNSDQAYPDLINPTVAKGAGLEVKTTIQIGKGGESHNGHSGWHCVACYKIEAAGGIRFVHVMFAVLNGHTHRQPDWVYVGSKVNKDTGSRRTETYNTNLIGLTKLRDGSVYLDTNEVDFSRWRQARRGKTPVHSIFATKTGFI
ncbi:MAG: helix-turn-helix domain-containing protein [Verrucomicrobiota bacterium]